MNIETTPAAIPTADWNATPLTVRQLVLALLEQVEHLQHRVAELEERLNQNSHHSSKPPSSDASGTPLRSSRPPLRSQSWRTTGSSRPHAPAQIVEPGAARA